jgi:hypothetical protein
MRDFLKSSGRWLSIGWFWIAVLLVLPNCSYTTPVAGGPNLRRGALPHSSAIFCDIEQVLGRRCPRPEDLATGIRLAEAAIALNEGRTSTVALDESPAARARCDGGPEAVLFVGPFPDGKKECLNCGVLGSGFTANAHDACQQACFDLFGTFAPDRSFVPDFPPVPTVLDFCAERARMATNQPLDGCFDGACNADGTSRADFIDPRRTPEPIRWQDLIGVVPDGPVNNRLRRTAPSTGIFDAGAASEQQITRGDGYVEFAASRNDQGHAVGFSQSDASCSPTCADTDPTLSDIEFAIVLSTGGRVGIVRNGINVVGPEVDQTFGAYAAGERFRVRLRDNSDGTAAVTFTRVRGACIPGQLCNETLLHPQPFLTPYPLHVDASLNQQGATLLDVRVVRIQ